MKKDLKKKHGKKQRNMVLKRNIILIAVAAIVIIVLGTGIIIFLATENSSKKSRIQMENGITSEICQTEECAKLGARMRLLMNESTDPCDDFYEFSCGNYGSNANFTRELEFYQQNNIDSLLEVFKIYNPETKSEKIAKIFMEKCVKTEGEEVNNDVWKSDDLTELLIEVAKVEPVNTGFVKNEIYFMPHEGKIILLLILRNGIQKYSNLEFTLDNVSTLNSKWMVEVPIEVKDVPSNVTFMDLKKYINNLLPEENRNEFPNWVVGVQLADLYLLEKVVKIKGIASMKKLLQKTWKSKLRSYKVYGDNKEEGCFKRTIELFPGTLAMIFIKKIVKSENIQKSNQIFEDLKIAFNEMLDENTWIDEDLKNNLREELKVLKSSLGIPDEHKDLSNIDRMYARVEKEQKVEDQSYLTLVRNLLKMNSEETFLRVARMETITYTGKTINFDANYGLISHRVSAAPFLLNYPYIDKSLPDWNTLASTGYALGHEIGHSFDTDAFFLNPSIKPILMSENVKNEFNQRIDCIIKKYDKFQFPDGSFSSGNFTKDEDTADMIGFNLAYRLFKKLDKKQQKLPGFENQTIEQNYFQRTANLWCEKDLEGIWLEHQKTDKHSAMKFRINGMMSNSVDFARAFGCKKGSPMNPEKKCPLFK